MALPRRRAGAAEQRPRTPGDHSGRERRAAAAGGAGSMLHVERGAAPMRAAAGSRARQAGRRQRAGEEERRKKDRVEKI